MVYQRQGIINNAACHFFHAAAEVKEPSHHFCGRLLPLPGVKTPGFFSPDRTVIGFTPYALINYKIDKRVIESCAKNAAHVEAVRQENVRYCIALLLASSVQPFE